MAKQAATKASAPQVKQLGRAIAAALVATGTSVVGIARDEQELRAVRDELGGGFTPVAADATGEAHAKLMSQTPHNRHERMSPAAGDELERSPSSRQRIAA